MKTANLNIKEFDIEELLSKRADYNPRTISAEQKNGLRHSIDRFGYVQNIIYNLRTETIVSGHQRLEVLKEEGFDKVQVHCIDISYEDEIQLNVLMNSKTITGEFTSELNELLQGILDTDPETFDVTSMQLLFLNDKDETKTKNEEEETKEVVKGMDLMPYESYDAILVICKRRDDFMFLSTKLGLGERRIISSPSVKNKKLGYTRCVNGADLIEILNGETNEEENDNIAL